MPRAPKYMGADSIHQYDLSSPWAGDSNTYVTGRRMSRASESTPGYARHIQEVLRRDLFKIDVEMEHSEEYRADNLRTRISVAGTRAELHHHLMIPDGMMSGEIINEIRGSFAELLDKSGKDDGEALKALKGARKWIDNADSEDMKLVNDAIRKLEG